MKECDSVNYVVSALVGFLRKTVINTDSIITFSRLFCLNSDINFDFFRSFRFLHKTLSRSYVAPHATLIGAGLDVGNHWFTQ
jgi:hypothetical protein